MKIKDCIFITAFTAALVAPAIAIPFTKSDNEREADKTEFPSVRTESGSLNSEYFDEFDIWVSENIGFRNGLINSDNAIKSALFGQSAEESIVLGKNGWLFYSETVKDYLNVSTLSERNALNVANTMKLVQDYADSLGTTFGITIALNKNSLYSENMPYYYIPIEDGNGNRELLAAAFEKSGVNYIDLYPALSSAEKVLYQERDSHWTYEGALLGYNTMMEGLGIEHLTFSDITFTEVNDWSSDLAEMVYPDETITDMQSYPNYEFSYEITSHEKNVDSITLTTYNEKGTGSAVIFRDSFFNTTQVYAAENFEDAVFSRAYPYRVDYCEKYKPTVMLLEIVERNLENLAFKAPVMVAPETSLTSSALSVNNADNYIFADDNGDYIQLYGAIDERYLGDEYEAYILAEAENGQHVYEAFPIFEKDSLMEKAEKGLYEMTENGYDNGFSAYFKKDIFSEFKSINLVITSNDNCYVFDSISIN
jgi:hypothetical protein